MPDDVAELIYRDDAATALRACTSRLCTVLRTEPDRDAPAIGSWTLGDVANHLASGVENYALWLQGHLSVDPLAWVLVSSGRRNQWSAALRGKISGWGKRPLLPFKLKAASFQG